MAQQPSQRETLLLWALIGLGGSSYQSKVGRKVASADRDGLKKAGLISAEKHGNKGVWIEVSDRGWAWASENLAAPLPATAQTGAILQAWLARLQTYMGANNVSLAEIIAPRSTKEARKAVEHGARERIRTAYRALAGGTFNKRVLLRDLRVKLSDLSRETFDDAVLQMIREEGSSLVELDNRREITPADRAAAILIGGEPRHILWIRS